MKAIRLHARGGPEQLICEEAPRPGLAAGNALIRVQAAGLTPAELTWPATYTRRDGTDRLPTVPGHDVSGVIEAIAPQVTEVRVGDAVYGLIDFWQDGAAAEYAAVRAADLAPKPRTLDHVHAAAVPLSALTAWQALFDHAGLQSGQRLLIHGAAGGVGTYAVQFARWRGAYVKATASGRNIDFLLALGAQEVIDYTQASFEKQVHNVDVVLDTIGGKTLERSWRVLRPGGVLVTLVAPISGEKGAARGIRGIFFIVKPSRVQLIEIGRLIDGGAVRPQVEAVYSLEQARQAFERGLQGHNRGKIVLQVAA